MSQPQLSTPVFLVLCLGLAVAAQAQTPPATGSAPGATSAAAPDSRVDRRIEHIRVEDTGSRIDELRVGGETQSITVSPKGGMPAYDVLPSSVNHGPANGQRSSSAASGGTRVWKILGF